MRNSQGDAVIPRASLDVAAKTSTAAGWGSDDALEAVESLEVEILWTSPPDRRSHRGERRIGDGVGSTVDRSVAGEPNYSAAN